VLLHGLSASSTSWQPVADRFGGSWRISAPALCGRGMSDHDIGGYRFDALVGDVHRVLDDVGEPAVVVGRSLGAIVAMQLAQNGHPLVRAVFLEDPPVDTISPFVLVHTVRVDVPRCSRRRPADAGGGEPGASYREFLAKLRHP
jgi:pimeloyl-ACP methyl ester carboxylesterase